jgi:hypothetical protein
VDFAQRVYGAAAKVSGMLTSVTIIPDGGGAPLTVLVAYAEPSEMVLGGEVLGSAPAISFATQDIPALTTRDMVNVGASEFRVMRVERLHDGGESRAILQKA